MCFHFSSLLPGSLSQLSNIRLREVYQSKTTEISRENAGDGCIRRAKGSRLRSEITDTNESKYLQRARREQEGAFSHQTNRHKHRYTPADLIKLRSAFVCPPLGSDFTNLPSPLHCPAFRTLARTRTQISRHKSKHVAAPRCVLCLQVSKSRRKHATATLLIYCQLSTESNRDCGKAER